MEFVWTGVIILSYFMIFFVVATIIKNNSIVDIGWGLGFVLTAWILMIIYGFSIEKLIVNVLVSFWGLRLFYYILRRNVFKAEDFRYKAWREAWGKWVIPRAFFQVFLLQGLFMYVVGISVFYVNLFGFEQGLQLSTLGYVSLIAGLVLWVIGYVFEVVGDRQLKMHIKNPNKEQRLMTKGLWQYTRHPNYFGEAVIWWGMALIALSGGGSLSVIVLISPVVITFLLRFVSGVPMLERKMSKSEGWDEYAKKTNAFIPWFPKK